MKKSVIRFIVPAITFLLVAIATPASGRGEDPVRQARELVSANRINDAILLLEQTVRDDPERIVEAEALMRTIREIRGEYNVLFELLIDNLVNNPEDITRTLQIIDQMEQLDQFPNERVLRQVEDARVIAQLAYDRNIVNETMDRARIALEANNYREAVEEYLSLEGLQRSQFDARGYGDIFVNRVNQAVDSLGNITGEFAAQVEPYRGAGRDLVSAAGDDAAVLSDDAFQPFAEEAEELLQILRRLETLSQDLIVLRSQVALQFPDQPVDWYLNFREMVTRGRGEFREREGLVYAVRKLYGDYPGQIASITGEQAATDLESGLNALAENRPEEAAQRFAGAERAFRYQEWAEAILLGVPLQELPPESMVEQYDRGEPERFIRAHASRLAAGSLGALSRSLVPLAALGPDQQQPLDTLEQRKETVRTVVAGTVEEGEQWISTSNLFGEIPEEYLSEEVGAILATVENRIGAGYSLAVERERDLAVRIAGLRTETAPASLAAASNELSLVEPLLEGVEEAIEDDAIRIVRYPDEALQRLAVLDGQISETLSLVLEAQEALREDEEYVATGENVQTEIQRLGTLATQLQQVRNRATEANGRAGTLIAEAEQDRNRGLQRIADARAAISAQQLEAARNNWNQARDAFFDSLEQREDPEFRVEADSLIADVGRELLELENIIVVQRVRELITRAEAQYNQDEYVAARDTLLQAQQTWEQTNVDPNSEIDRLLLLATAALNLEEGRELSPTDPLYPVLGNYLSLAREDFNRGVRFFEAGDRNEADRFFDRSIENLRNVRDVRPLNWDSRILELRIVQLRDADEFEEIFATRFNQAVARLDQAGPLEVYSEIEVLAEINPDYPGIQQQLRRLEIMLNLRPDPIDQQRITRANQLYQQASNLAGGSRDQMTVAVSLLEDAVDLNPGNNNARFLLDQLRIRLGGQATAALSTTDEQQYRRAETLFQQGQVLQALAITERLLSNAANQGYPPLVELRRRIGLRLGI
ncbi:MAG: hypothetical protein EA427_05865 [Spirochaetaceae bacterium]|nr:MAG: hypothetical protein EA427_05865 [Spirochaetaceae bacterium]